MNYFKGLALGYYNHLPKCNAWLDQTFDDHALNFCRTGRILWSMNGEKPKFITGPVAWWTVPGPRYTYGSMPGETWEHFYTTFNGTRIEQMLETDLIPFRESSHFRFISEGEQFGATFSRLINIANRQGTSSPRVVLILEDLFLQLQEQTPPLQQLSPLEIEVRAWVDEIHRMPCKAWCISEQARRLAVSEVHLRRVMKQIVGMPPHRFILERRLEHCAMKLRSSNQPVKSLAAECGFADIPHFTRLFTRHYGTSPAAYRLETQLRNGESMQIKTLVE